MPMQVYDQTRRLRHLTSYTGRNANSLPSPAFGAGAIGIASTRFAASVMAATQTAAGGGIS